MQIIFDIAKRDITLLKRGLDFGDAGLVFAGRHLTSEDCRQDYGKARYITVGVSSERMVVLVWTPRGAARRSFP
ncbi:MULTISPECIES: BrnT family toxin [unclassified Pseudomonas]|uniref:BrnT family toxin n=1 Tax=unclassified Pseudomonas TaxID=196821 RepID=UPI001FD1FAEC|nr:MULTISPECIES: BrnT family toxin [unclassified Pseudomonas]